MKPDLTTLYSELGLEQNCSLAELQLAYRRRISELQPNRAAGSALAPESAAALRHLIALYTTASRFHRRYGRLPGAEPHRSRGGGPAPFGIAQVRTDDGQPVSRNHSSTQSRVALVVTIALLVLLFGLLAVASGEWLT